MFPGSSVAGQPGSASTATALDVAPDGQGLAMGSTTGGGWISDNGGKAWDAIPMRLPPVHCVRWSAG